MRKPAIVLFLLLSACTSTGGLPPSSPYATWTAPAPTILIAPTLLPTHPPTATPTATLPPSPSPQPPRPSPTRTSTSMPIASPQPPTPSPTYAILRGEVLQRSNCRYGPGAPYLYKYGLVVGSNLEIFGRNEAGTWLLVRAIGGTNPCWVRADLMQPTGDVMAVEPTYIPLPQSPYYPPLTGVTAVRRGDQVTVSWNARSLRAGDDTASPPYLVEAWTCMDGTMQFTPIGSYEPFVTVVDQSGCSEPSRARAYLVEKHGYTRWVEVKFPLIGE